MDHAYQAIEQACAQAERLIASNAASGEVLACLIAAAERLSGHGAVSSVLVLDDAGLLRNGASPNLPADYLRAIDGLSIGPKAGSCGTAAYRREPVVVEDIATDALWEPYRDTALGHGLPACWSTPIFDGQRRVLGTFALYFRAPRSPTSRHLHLIDVTTYTAAIAIVHSRERADSRRREAQFADAERIASLGSYEWEAHTNTVRRSPGLCRLFGLSPQAFAPGSTSVSPRTERFVRARAGSR
jgi:GAF domain-containing protein